ncbi:hypothetical protein MBLNU457_3327t2 [Dothideomycetes sp. NU457]
MLKDLIEHHTHAAPPFPGQAWDGGFTYPLPPKPHKLPTTTGGQIEVDTATQDASSVSELLVLTDGARNEGLVFPSAPEKAITTRNLIEPNVITPHTLPVTGLLALIGAAPRLETLEEEDPGATPRVDPLEKEIKKIKNGPRSDQWRARMLRMIREVANEQGGYPAERHQKALDLIRDLQRPRFAEKYRMESLPFLRSILAAHNTKVADAIHPEQLGEPGINITDSHYVFVAIDTEFDNQGVVMFELGFAAIDTADIVDKMPGPKGKGWFNLVKATHLEIRNEDVVRNRRPYNFGSAKIVTVEDASRQVRKMIDELHKAGRRVVIVGQGLSGDLERLRFVFGFNITTLPGVVGILDTNEIATSAGANARLGLLYNAFNDEEGRNFHNAGNDAVYCLRVMLSLAMTPQNEWPCRPFRVRPLDHYRRVPVLQDKVILPDRRVPVLQPGSKLAPAGKTIGGWLRNLKAIMQNMIPLSWKGVKKSDNSMLSTKEPRGSVLRRAQRAQFKWLLATRATAASDWVRVLLKTVQDMDAATWTELKLSKRFQALTNEQKREIRSRRRESRLGHIAARAPSHLNLASFEENAFDHFADPKIAPKEIGCGEP